MSDLMETVHAAWGPLCPDWVITLARACGETSQNKVALKIGRSGALVSQVLRAKYPGDLSAVEELVRGHFENAVVDCPALGFLPTHECRMWRDRAKAFVSSNSLRVQMYRACAKCPRAVAPEGKP